MKALVKDARIVTDPYITIAADEPLPVEGDFIVSLAHWQRDREKLRGRASRVGVRLKSDEPPALIAEDLDVLTVLALEFPVFRDGRAYSYARLLREQYRYHGEIRAVGDVLLEQLQFMVRVGFDAFELDSDDPERDFRIALGEFSVWYQPAADAHRSALELRSRGA